MYGREIDEYLLKYLSRGADEAFKEAIQYQVLTGGKRYRPIITIVSAQACGGDRGKALPAAAIVELIHNYSLIFDDIIDEAVLRRGKPTVRARYGDNAAMLIGLWYREAIEEAILETTNPPLFARETARTIREIIEGERLDILMECGGRKDPFFVENRLCQRLVKGDWNRLYEVYKRMITLKTAALIRTSAVFGAYSAGAKDVIVNALRRYGESLGLAFQIIDDVLDIFGDVRKFGKEIGKDIKEHKLGNAVIVFALRELTDSDRERLLSILEKETIMDEDVKEAVDIIAKTNAREIAIEEAQKHAEEAIRALEILGENEYAGYLREIAWFTVRREY